MIVTSASSGPRLQSSEVPSDPGSTVGGGGVGVSDGDTSVGVEDGPNDGGVLVAVGSACGEEVDVDVQEVKSKALIMSRGSRLFTENLIPIVYFRNRYQSLSLFFCEINFILPSMDDQTTQ